MGASEIPPIGKLERVPLREVWEHEAYDFTQWLQDNIEVLNDALGLTLVTHNTREFSRIRGLNVENWLER